MPEKLKASLILILLGASLHSSGASIQCQPNTLASYIALGSAGCSIGPAVFSDFSYLAAAAGGAVNPGPALISVTPFASPSGPALTISGPWSVQGTVGPLSLDFTLTYNVLTGGGFVGLTGSLGQAIASGSGGISATEFVCVGGVFSSAGDCSGTAQALPTLLAVAGFAETTGSLSFPSTGQLGVYKNVILSSDAAGSASLGTLMQIVQTPEPSALLLVPAGWIALVVLRGRCSRQDVTPRKRAARNQTTGSLPPAGDGGTCQNGASVRFMIG